MKVSTSFEGRPVSRLFADWQKRSGGCEDACHDTDLTAIGTVQAATAKERRPQSRPEQARKDVGVRVRHPALECPLVDAPSKVVFDVQPDVSRVDDLAQGRTEGGYVLVKIDSESIRKFFEET